MGKYKHGMARRNGRLREYWIWHYMKTRCHNPNASGYYKYGARGIKVCDRWRDSFEAFYQDMGPRPSSQHEIDRIDNKGNYEPGNCQWATKRQNYLNKDRTRWLTFQGKTQCLKDWSAELGLPYSTLQNRLNAGLTVEQAFTNPRGARWIAISS